MYLKHYINLKLDPYNVNTSILFACSLGLMLHFGFFLQIYYNLIYLIHIALRDAFYSLYMREM